MSMSPNTGMRLQVSARARVIFPAAFHDFPGATWRSTGSQPIPLKPRTRRIRNKSVGTLKDSRGFFLPARSCSARATMESTSSYSRPVEQHMIELRELGHRAE